MSGLRHGLLPSALVPLAAAALSVGMAAPVTVGTPAHRVDCRIVRCVALTFDDGPTQYTAPILNTLQRQHVPATFFLIGPHALHYRTDVLREYRSGDAIGDHTVTHPRLTVLPLARIESEIGTAARQITSVTGQRPRLFRPPFGAWNAKVRMAAGAEDMAMIMWSVTARDWKFHDPLVIEHRVLSLVRPGAIVVLHDRYATTPLAIPHIIRALQARGYHLVTVPQLFGSTKGLRPGVLYRHGP
ncbi:polysaccharide deacetylase family protein [Streptomyces broussonetiae]|uniref:Polysaccharide deacetylase family protein n=1 Tax=Streptomyces broussonetiae TaxID=2686304 RepID=A0A6I6NE50_9ACTN|nr:polysaccharide deacetylase family protein [Streptomyces broussonetiae]QHA09129.1 polysaccharide deacetylase family protein [Streptomyces broussonetiae]